MICAAPRCPARRLPDALTGEIATVTDLSLDDAVRAMQRGPDPRLSRVGIPQPGWCSSTARALKPNLETAWLASGCVRLHVGYLRTAMAYFTQAMRLRLLIR
jgi:hypothetical protein